MGAPVFVEESVHKALKANAKVKALTEDRVFPVKIPEGTPLPCVVFQRVSSRPDTTLQGYNSESVYMMVNCFALKYTEAKKLALAVREAMATVPLYAAFVSDTDSYNNDAEVFINRAEYRCRQHGGYCYEQIL